MLKVRLFRPFSIEHFAKALPASVRRIAVLDRTKEPGALGEPLYLDVVAALLRGARVGRARARRRAARARRPLWAVLQGVHAGAWSRPCSTTCARASARATTSRSGIVDDVTHTSLPVDQEFDIEAAGRVRAVFFGLGADGTVGANKNSIKIIGEETDNDAQGYFVYDSKKSGAVTISHLRFGPGPIRSPYLIRRANFVACHQWGFLEKYDVLEYAVPGGTFLLNAPYPKAELWNRLPREVQEQILEKKLRLYAIDAYKVAEATGMGNRINSVMQTCFFAISGVLPPEQAIAQDQAGDREDVRQEGRRDRQAQLGRGRRHAREPARGRARARSPATASCAPRFRRRRPTSSSASRP